MAGRHLRRPAAPPSTGTGSRRGDVRPGGNSPSATPRTAVPRSAAARPAYATAGAGTQRLSSQSARGRTPSTGVARKRLIDYPRRGKRGLRRWLPSWKLVLGLASIWLFAVFGVFGVAYAVTTIPDPNALVDAQTTVVTYADGQTELGTFSAQNRTNVDLAVVPEHVKQSVLSAEDRTFYSNSGVNPVAVARAAINNVRGGDTQGGSTITQQYVKKYFLSDEQTIQRKAREFFLALKINRQQSKEEILENYLNTVYFGRGAYGIQAASQAYFGKPVEQIGLSEAALLAGIIQAPSRYDPLEEPESSQRRWAYVLDGMVEEGWLSPSDRAAQQFPAVLPPVDQDRLAGQAGYLLQMVEKEMQAKGYTREQLETEGLRIRTTFEKDKIDAAVAAIEEELPEERPAGLRVALTAIRPNDGAVVAVYGGPDYVQRSFNDATQGIAQAGSTFKPFTLAAALENGISLRSRFNGANDREFDEYENGRPVPNFGGQSYGRIDLIEATENSVNTVYVDLGLKVGSEKVLDATVRAGIPADSQDLGPYASLPLGTASVHPFDMANAYATFAAGGMRATPYVVAEVTKANGGVVFQAKPQMGRAFPQDVSNDVTYAMQRVVESGSGTTAQELGRPVAGKTGTTNDNKSAWFVGFTPQLSTSVALFNSGENGEQLSLAGLGGRRSVTGGSYPTSIWTAFMETAMDGVEEVDFPEPSYVGDEDGGDDEPTESERPRRRSTEPQEPQTQEPEPTAEPTFVEPTEEPTEPGRPGRPCRPFPECLFAPTVPPPPDEEGVAPTIPPATAEPVAPALG